jgi:hypothetical protein
MKFNTLYSLLLFFLISLANNSFAQEDTTSSEPEVDPMGEEFADLTSPKPEKEQEKKPQVVDPIKFFDMGVYSTQKSFKSRKVKRHSMWEKIENDCGLDLEEIPIELTTAFENISRVNQSSIYDLVKGNVKISNQIISPTERQFMHSPFLTPGSSSKIFGCLSGMSYREENFILNNVGYFALVLQNLKYLKEELQYSYHKNGHTYRTTLIRNKNDMDDVLTDPTKVGFVVSLGGGHSLGNYLFIEQGQVATSDYQNMVLDNIKQLKGITPIADDPKTFLDIPIFSINFGNYFDDGICGKASRFSIQEEEAFKRPTTIDGDMTVLGQAAIRLLTDNTKGRRILIDMGGMSLRSRLWYHKYAKDQRFRKDTIPIIVTGVGVSGLSYKDNNYGRDNKKGMISHQGANLCRQDLLAIVESRGLIAISLEKDKLMGKEFQDRYDAAIPNSAERHRIAIDAIAANVCMAIHKSNNIEAWNVVSLSSQFDAHARHMDVFDSSNEMLDLYRELLRFFENPREIPGVYTVKEIKTFMYNFTATEIVNKIMYKNALRFLKEHLPEVSK